MIFSFKYFEISAKMPKNRVIESIQLEPVQDRAMNFTNLCDFLWGQKRASSK